MRNRNVKIQVWLSKKEADNLQKKAKRSHISVAAYLRHLINGVVPQDAPPPDYYAMMQQLYRIGNNLNQIAQKAHTLNVVDVQRYDTAVSQFEFSSFLFQFRTAALQSFILLLPTIQPLDV